VHLKALKGQRESCSHPPVSHFSLSHPAASCNGEDAAVIAKEVRFGMQLATWLL
jgi:hypothetical protein